MATMLVDEKEPTSVFLRNSQELGSTGKPAVVELRLASLRRGVDLGAIWRAAAAAEGRPCFCSSSSGVVRKVRLNGHFVSSGQDGVSTVTWRDLVSFFSSRGYPDGLRRSNPITVSSRAQSVPEDASICLKRAYVASMPDEDDTRMSKRPRCYQQEKGGSMEADETSIVDHSIQWMKRKLTLGDEDGEKKRSLKKRITAAIASHKAPACCSEAIRLFALQTAASTSNLKGIAGTSD